AAAAVNVLPGFGTRARRERHLPARDAEFLDGYHAVAAQREHRAGHDLDTVGGGGERQRRVAGGLGRLNAERARTGADRLAVERNAIPNDAVERRLVALGVDVLAQHRAGALRERQRLDRQALQVLPDQQVRLSRCEHSALLVGPRLEDLHLLVETIGNALQ